MARVVNAGSTVFDSSPASLFCTVARMPSICSSVALRSLLSAAAAAMLGGGSLAQTVDDGGAWFGWFAQGKLGAADGSLAPLRWWLDVQDRLRDEGEQFDQFLLRPGLGYALTDRLTAWVGYAYIATDPVRRDEFGENRLWQQLTYNAPTDGFTLQGRARLEERFVETDGDTGYRLRVLAKAMVPMVADKSLFASVWDEAFWDLNDTDWGERTGFRQNRAFAGLGLQLDDAPKVWIEVGYMNEWIDRRGPDKENHVLSISLFTVF